MKIKPILLTILSLIYIANIIGQGDARLMLENKYYGDKNNVKYSISVNPSLGALNPEANSMMDDCVLEALKKYPVFDNTKPLKEETSITTLLNDIPYQYLFNITLNQAEKIPLTKNNKLYNFSANIECIDVVKGTTLIFDTVDWVAEAKSNSENEEAWKDKTFRKFLISLQNRISNHVIQLFHICPTINELVEVKGTKVKKVGIDNRMFKSIGKPNELYVYRVLDQVQIDGQEHFTYSMVGVIRPTNEVYENGILVMNVGDGKKEILKYFNEEIKLYTSIKLLGDDE